MVVRGGASPKINKVPKVYLKVGAVHLVPLVSSVNGISIWKDGNHTGILVQSSEVTPSGKAISLSISPAAQPKDPSMSKWGQNDDINPYFWVKETPKKEDGNVILKYKKLGAFSLPYYWNPKGIKAGFVLYVYKEVKAKIKLDNASYDNASKPSKKARSG